ncbi:MFS transporter [Pendulispora brunnea]|uniref:MFS transporter n=1 Tax=Pendulispora brunnea TaxID=2905690 RepID=A0ABZ2KSQ4_9BACT
MSRSETIRPTNGLALFYAMMAGQFVSFLGSGLTAFALGVWVYQETHSVTRFGAAIACRSIPFVVLSPLAGSLIDRWDRRKGLIAAESLASTGTLAVLALLSAGWLRTWHVYPVIVVSAIAHTYRNTALNSVATVLVPSKDLGRAAVAPTITQAAEQLVPPLLCPYLLLAIDLRGVLLLDFVSFSVALLPLVLVRIPAAPKGEGALAQGLLGDIRFGFRYIGERPGLLGLVSFAVVINFALCAAETLLTPYVLDMVPSPEEGRVILGRVLFCCGMGVLVGSVLMGIWGGPRRRVLAVYAFGAVYAASFVLAGLQRSAVLIAAAGFAIMFSVTLVKTTNLAIWQSKVAADVQGRVFGAITMIAWCVAPVAQLSAGPLVALLGGHTRGNSLLFVTLGFVLMVMVGVTFFHPRIRNIEDELPELGSP